MQIRNLDIGTVLVFRGQPFRLDRFERRASNKGRPLWFAIWIANCRKCGVAFESALRRESLALGACCPVHRATVPNGQDTKP